MTVSTPPLSVEELRALEAAATPGPWEIGHPMERNYIYGCDSHLAWIGSRENSFPIHDDGSLNESEANAALIVAMRNALPGLLASTAKAEERIVELEAAIERAIGHISGGLCYVTAEAKHEQLRDADRVLCLVLGGQP
jgi:hypothetical protein